MARGKYCEYPDHGSRYRATGSRDMQWYVRVTCPSKSCPDMQIWNVCRACAMNIESMIKFQRRTYCWHCWNVVFASELYYVYKSV